MKLRAALVLTTAITLAACGDPRKDELAWGERCLHAGYTADQCGLMLEQLKASRQAVTAASMSGVMSGVAAGIAASGITSRR